MVTERTYEFDEFTDVTTFESLKDLQERHDMYVKRNMKGYTISDIYESSISYSFRVFDNKNQVTKYFLQYIKS